MNGLFGRSCSYVALNTRKTFTTTTTTQHCFTGKVFNSQCSYHDLCNMRAMTAFGLSRKANFKARVNGRLLLGGFKPTLLTQQHNEHSSSTLPSLLPRRGLSVSGKCAQVLPAFLNTLCGQTRHFSDDGKDDTDLVDELLSPNIKIEKQLLKFMDMWELDKAIKLLRLAVNNNIIPNQTVILNLLQQLANLGEVDFLVEMHDFLLEEKLCTNTAFYTSLQQAYFNSGRLEEGVDFLRKIYHLTRKYQDVDIYFVLLTVMILRHFPDKESLVTQFVKDLGERVPEDHEVKAALWKCYFLTEQFSKADELTKMYGMEMKPFLPIMINDIILERNKVDTNRRIVLQRVLDCNGLSQKQSALLVFTYASLLAEEADYRECLEVLTKAKEQKITLKKDKILPLLKVLSIKVESTHNETEEEKLRTLQEWIETLS